MLRTPAPTQKQRLGLSLIELIIVLLIIGLLMGLSLSIYGKVMDDQVYRASVLTVRKTQDAITKHWNEVLRQAKDERIPDGSTRVTWIKKSLTYEFPVTFAEAQGATSRYSSLASAVASAHPSPVGDTNNTGESAACIYQILKKGRSGISTDPDVLYIVGRERVDPGDSLQEIRDAWGTPLALFRVIDDSDPNNPRFIPVIFSAGKDQLLGLTRGTDPASNLANWNTVANLEAQYNVPNNPPTSPNYARDNIDGRSVR